MLIRNCRAREYSLLPGSWLLNSELTRKSRVFYLKLDLILSCANGKGKFRRPHYVTAFSQHHRPIRWKHVDLKKNGYAHIHFNHEKGFTCGIKCCPCIKPDRGLPNWDPENEGVPFKAKAYLLAQPHFHQMVQLAKKLLLYSAPCRTSIWAKCALLSAACPL